MVTVVDAVTLPLFAMKDTLVAPARMVTLGGTVTTAGLLLERETRAPLLGAGRLSVTEPKEGDPPTTGLGVKLREVRVGPPGGGWGVTVNEAVCVKPELDAEIVTVVELAEVIVDTGNAAIVDPAAIVTLAGTVAREVLLLDKEKTVPPLGAGALRMISPVEAFPPLTLVGFNVSENEIGEACEEGLLPGAAAPPHEYE
jgi:hypothetical protein